MANSGNHCSTVHYGVALLNVSGLYGGKLLKPWFS